jgi:hypothetical protein
MTFPINLEIGGIMWGAFMREEGYRVNVLF